MLAQSSGMWHKSPLFFCPTPPPRGGAGVGLTTSDARHSRVIPIIPTASSVTRTFQSVPSTGPLSTLRSAFHKPAFLSGQYPCLPIGNDSESRSHPRSRRTRLQSEMSMYGASSSQSSVRDYHVAVACALIEYVVLQPDRPVYDLACPLGLLLLASFDHPDTVRRHSLSDVISSLAPAAEDKQASAELLAAASVAKLFGSTPKKNKKHVYTPKKSNKKHPRKDQIASAVSARVRELLANGDIDTGSPSSVTSVFWDWLGDKNALGPLDGGDRSRRHALCARHEAPPNRWNSYGLRPGIALAPSHAPYPTLPMTIP